MPHDHGHGGHAHTHAHSHGHGTDLGDRRLGLAIAVNLALTAAQIAGGVLAGSLALIADALHNFSDAAALVIAFWARRIAKRPQDGAMTFGYGRAEMVAALVNYVTLILLGLYLLWEAGARFLDPQPVEGWTVVGIAVLALVIDTATALLTRSMAAHSANIRAAYLHNLADAMGSVAVIVSGTLILLYDWRLADPIVTALIAGYILWHAAGDIRGVIAHLMLAAPPGLDTAGVIAAVAAVPGVKGVHNIRIWQPGEHSAAFDAHLVIEAGRWGDADAIKAGVKARLAGLGIGSSTLEMECAAHACPVPARFGTG